MQKEFEDPFLKRKAKHSEKLNKERALQKRDRRIHFEEDEDESLDFLDKKTLYKLTHFRGKDD